MATVMIEEDEDWGHEDCESCNRARAIAAIGTVFRLPHSPLPIVAVAEPVAEGWADLAGERDWIGRGAL